MLSVLRTAVLFSTSDFLASLPLTGSERWQRQPLRPWRRGMGVVPGASLRDGAGPVGDKDKWISSEPAF